MRTIEKIRRLSLKFRKEEKQNSIKQKGNRCRKPRTLSHKRVMWSLHLQEATTNCLKLINSTKTILKWSYRLEEEIFISKLRIQNALLVCQSQSLVPHRHHAQIIKGNLQKWSLQLVGEPLQCQISRGMDLVHQIECTMKWIFNKLNHVLALSILWSTQNGGGKTKSMRVLRSTKIKDIRMTTTPAYNRGSIKVQRKDGGREPGKPMKRAHLIGDLLRPRKLQRN